MEAFPTPGRHAIPVFTGYPAPYRVGMSNLGFHFLFRGLRKSSQLRVERLFSDTAPFTVESGAPLSSAVVILFSVSYEEDYLNLVRMLVQSGISPLREERGGRPIVIAGGPAVSANPIPITGIVDVVSLGEGERPLQGIIDVLCEGKRQEPQQILDRLAEVSGLFIPGSADRRTFFSPPAELVDFPRSVIITPDTVFSRTLLVESGRGCPGACSFCLATAIYRPYRALPLSALDAFVSSLSDQPDRLGLVSTAVAAHPEFSAMVELLDSKGFSISFSSFRAEDLDDGKISLIGSVGTRSVSLAPESGSERLRFRMGKKIPDGIYFDAAARLRQAGVRHFGLYLLVGLPGETRETFQETRSFLQGFARAIGTRRFGVHVNVLVPKPWTPLQFHAMPSERELEERLVAMRHICHGLGISVKTKSVRSALRQAVLSLGDERVGKAIVHLVTRHVSWKKSLAIEGVDTRFPHRRKGIDTVFPWDAIDGPVDRRFLWRRFNHLAEIDAS